MDVCILDRTDAGQEVTEDWLVCYALESIITSKWIISGQSKTVKSGPLTFDICPFGKFPLGHFYPDILPCLFKIYPCTFGKNTPVIFH